MDFVPLGKIILLTFVMKVYHSLSMTLEVERATARLEFWLEPAELEPARLARARHFELNLLARLARARNFKD